MAKAAAKTQKYPVLEVFRDKETKRKYPVGSVYETDDQDRADYLREFGYLGNPETDEPDPAVKADTEKSSGDPAKSDADEPDPAASETKTNGKADKE
ncbi:hypothetical protein [Paenibacillus xylanilyticus]|uniref:Uncharacterized protein n=1 Tax=Paenibacillus xylanilyticus TaxID=248903 RepID=A0A7Y6BRW7_9BACL|nr:hypothetical protein [Paenibacillus xylanilyticus]NUU73817.1 hypothetical protein [Paenibacillus xylanilyticus]